MVTTDIQRVIENSVQNPPPHGAGLYMLSSSHTDSKHVLAPYGSVSLDKQLRELSRDMYGSLFMGARASLAKQVAATEWVIRGKRNINTSQELLQNAQWGAGWVSFIEALVKDFTTYNMGAVVEIIGAGDSNKPIAGKVAGIKTLDPTRCYLTGDAETPLIYENYWLDGTGRRQSSYHLMHYTRVKRFVDLYDSDERLLGIGESALYRYVGHHYRQMLMGRYSVEKLSDTPPAGFLVLGNVRQQDIEDATRQYEADRAAAGQTVWRNVQQIQALDPSQNIQVEFINFASLPDGFDYTSYMENDRNIVALSLGIDPQDIWPLQGGLAGTSGQSKVLSDKARGKTLGILYQEIEAFINLYVIPPSAEFRFKPEDDENDIQRAERAKIWVQIASQSAGEGFGSAQLFTPMEQRQLLANTVPEIRDVITDETGMVTLPDTDVREDEPTVTEPPQPEQPAPTEQPQEMVADNTTQEETREKSYTAVRADFIARVGDTIQSAVDGKLSRRRFGTIMRAHLSRSGRAAMLEGLDDGGVSVNSLEGNDKTQFAKWLSEQSGFVTSLGDRIFKADAKPNAISSASIWANKSLNSVYQAGLMSADRNGMYVWMLGDTLESCRTCRRADGQVHRLKAWHDSGIMPQSSHLECGGYQCKCSLKKTNKPASGRIGRI